MRQFVAPLVLIAGCSGADVAPATLCPNGKCAVVNSFLAAQVQPVTPATGNAILPAQEVAQVFIDNDNHFTLMLERAITLGGTLTDATGASVAAAVVLSRPSHIAGQPNVIYTTRAGDTGDWSAVVSPTHAGEYYTVRVQPDETTRRPPEVFLIDGGHDRTLMLQLADPTKLLQIHGAITNALQAPVAGMEVQAHDPVTDALVSTTAITDAQGSFALRVAVAQTPVAGNPSPPMPLASVKLVATPPQAPSTGMWLPRLEQAVDVTHAGAVNTLTVNLALPALPNAAQLVYNVVGVSTSGKQTQVAAAHCQFSADVSDPKSETRAFYEVAADTDATGNAAVMLIPASDVNRGYQVAVSPPSTSEFQAQASMLSVGPSGGYGGSIQLPLRAQVTGNVLGPDGAPVKNLNVIPHPATLAAVLAPLQDTVSKLSVALTDTTGGFVLRVDNGGYDLELVPIAADMLPHWWIEDLQVDGDLTLQSPVTIPPATPVVGQVTDAAGMPLVGADVQLYQVPTGNASCATADYACLSPPRRIAEGTVGKDGSLSVLLPGSPN